MKIEIEINEKQARFLKMFAEKQYPGSDDNHYTHMPIHVVEVEDDVYFEADSEYGDDVCFFLGEDHEKYDKENEVVEAYYEMRDKECPIEIMPYEKAYAKTEFIGTDGKEHIIVNYEDYFRAYGVEYINVCCYVKKYRPVAFFFIHEEAKRYIQYQRHNLTRPRVYTYSPGYSNCGDYEPFWELLMNLGMKLLKEEAPTVEENKEQNQ